MISQEIYILLEQSPTSACTLKPYDMNTEATRVKHMHAYAEDKCEVQT